MNKKWKLKVTTGNQAFEIELVPREQQNGIPWIATVELLNDDVPVSYAELYGQKSDK